MSNPDHVELYRRNRVRPHARRPHLLAPTFHHTRAGATIERMSRIERMPHIASITAPARITSAPSGLRRGTADALRAQSCRQEVEWAARCLQVASAGEGGLARGPMTTNSAQPAPPRVADYLVGQ